MSESCRQDIAKAGSRYPSKARNFQQIPGKQKERLVLSLEGPEKLIELLLGRLALGLPFLDGNGFKRTRELRPQEPESSIFDFSSVKGKVM